LLNHRRRPPADVTVITNTSTKQSGKRNEELETENEGMTRSETSHAIWKGSISFGLVNIPVSLHAAESRKELSFKLLHRTNMSPIHYKRVDEASGGSERFDLSDEPKLNRVILSIPPSAIPDRQDKEMGLKEYQRKRDFNRTPEPRGGVPRKSRGNSYFIQRHAARRIHYDLRLELDGVLVSWAIPKGPSLDPKERRLAVHVEDHPIEYGDFEGNIPRGEYGGGTVLLWDRGTWEPEGDPHEGIRRGDLQFKLHGEKLHGSWVLVRMGKRAAGEDEKENWMLIKHSDESAMPMDKLDILRERPESVSTGLSMEQITADCDREWNSRGETPKKELRENASKVFWPQRSAQGDATISFVSLR
jgi:DNA ligase D-like protein (predicted 3'-phosphoesterase)